MTYIPASKVFAPATVDRFTMPGDIPDGAEGEPVGTPSETWQSRGLASPAGRGWEPVAPAEVHPAAVAGHDAPIDPPGVFDRERQRAFLIELAECGQVRAASARCGISYRTAYRERRGNPAFARAWDAALLSARAMAEDVLATRALDGVEEAVFYRGELIATRRRYDSRHGATDHVIALPHRASRLADPGPERQGPNAKDRGGSRLRAAAAPGLRGGDRVTPAILVCTSCHLSRVAFARAKGGARQGNPAPSHALLSRRRQPVSDEQTFRKGDKVEWNSHGGTATGTVVRKLTEPMDIDGHHVAASQDNVEYLVETEDGAQAAHKPGALRKR